MKPVRFGIVGFGNIGRRHAAVIAAEEDAEVVGICDIDEQRQNLAAETYKGIVICRSIEDLLERQEMDVINICTPHHLHAEQALLAIAARKHVLVEKPMALSGRDCGRMIQAARAAGSLLMVVKQNRYNVPVVLLKEAIEERRLGRILMAQCNVVWNRFDGYYEQSPWLGRTLLEGGALFTQVSHFIDLLIWLCGDVVDGGGRIETKHHRIETEDCGSAWLRFAGGALGSLFWTTCAYHKNVEGSLTIVGERGTAKIGGQYLNQIEHWEVEGYPLRKDIEWVDRPNAYGRYQGSSSNHDKVIRDVVRRVREEDVIVVNGEEAEKTVRAIELIYERCSRPGRS